MAYKLQGKECFFDDFLLNTELTTAPHMIHHPVRKERVIVHNEMWEGDGCGYHNFFRDGDIYRMYYTAFHYDSTNVAPCICYAESTFTILCSAIYAIQLIVYNQRRSASHEIAHI